MSLYVGEKKKESKKIQCHTHKLAMHRREKKGGGVGIWNFGCRGICNVLCVREQWNNRADWMVVWERGSMGIGWESSILSGAVQYSADVLDRAQIGQERHQIGQLGIMGVIKPRGNRDGIIWMEDV
jgi:hypothetical protein